MHARCSVIQQRWYQVREKNSALTAYPPFRTTHDFTLTGALDVAALERSFAQLSRRQWSLRSVFAQDGDTLFQTVRGPEHSAQLEIYDASTTALDPARLDAIVRELYVRPIDLTRGPPCHCGLIALDEDRHRLVMGVDHMVHDGASWRILAQDLWSLYSALRDDPAADIDAVLGELPRQYLDWAADQWRYIESSEGEALRAFWTGCLADAPDLELPHTDGPFVQGMSPTRRASLDFDPGRAWAERLEAVDPVGRGSNAALARIARRPLALMSVLFALIRRTTGQRDVCIVMPSSSRTPDTSRVIGHFTIPLILRVRVDDDLTFVQLFQRVREAFFEVHQWRRAPAYAVINARPGLWRLAFNYQGMEFSSRVPGLDIAPTPAKYRPWPHHSDMDLQVFVSDSGMQADVHVDAFGREPVFSADGLQTLVSEYAALATSLLANPDSHIA